MGWVVAHKRTIIEVWQQLKKDNNNDGCFFFEKEEDSC